jgi:UDP-N-acetylglucosamine:LPS N-acetylglucosamine transferase
VNATQLAKVGAANIINEHELNPQNLRMNIDTMLRDRALLDDMGQRAGKIHINNAAAQVYNMAKGR